MDNEYWWGGSSSQAGMNPFSAESRYDYNMYFCNNNTIKYKIEEIMSALDYYIEKTNRRVTIEYIMLAGINDSDKCAKELSNLLKGKLVYVNLIPYNETENFNMKRSNDFKIKEFCDILKSNNINVTIRKEMGGNLSAACGQLRANNMK